MGRSRRCWWVLRMFGGFVWRRCQYAKDFSQRYDSVLREDHRPTCSTQLKFPLQWWYARSCSPIREVWPRESSSILTEQLCRHLPTTIFRFISTTTGRPRQMDLFTCYHHPSLFTCSHCLWWYSITVLQRAIHAAAARMLIKLEPCNVGFEWLSTMMKTFTQGRRRCLFAPLWRRFLCSWKRLHTE